MTWEAVDHARLYQRPDLQLPKENQPAKEIEGYQYAVISTQYRQHQRVPSDWRVLHTVEVQGAPLFYIYAIDN